MVYKASQKNNRTLRTLSDATVGAALNMTSADAPIDPATEELQWNRNPLWITLDVNAVSGSTQILQGIVAVPRYGSYVNLVVQGNYHVNWGITGATSLHASSSEAEYIYDFNHSDLNDTDRPVTFSVSPDNLVNRTSHGLTNGSVVKFYNITGATGIVADTSYYVVNSDTDDFQVSHTEGGSPVAITTTGSATLLPYKQALVTVSAQAGANLTAIDLQEVATSVQSNSENGWLDIVASLPQLASGGLSSAFLNLSMLERVVIKNVGSAPGSLASVFSGCVALKSVSLPSNLNGTSYDSMFNACTSLQAIGLTLSGAGSCTDLFQSCRNLKKVVLDAPLATGFTRAFQNCSSLVSVVLNIPSCTTCANMFQNCYSLRHLPYMDTPASTAYGSTFQNCYNLEEITINAPSTNYINTFFACSSLKKASLKTDAAVNMGGCFSNCTALEEVNLTSTASCLNFSSMFQSCQVIKYVKIDISAATTVASMFNSCRSLLAVDLIMPTSGSTAGNNMFQNCSSLLEIDLNCQTFSTALSMFSGCQSLRRARLNLSSSANMTSTFSDCQALEFIDLTTTSATTIMTSLFSNCYSLKTIVGSLNTSGVVTINNMFANCTSLIEVPYLDLSAATNVQGMFQSASTLRRIPALNFTNIGSSTNFNNMFSGTISCGRILATGFRFSFTLTNLRLDSVALDEVYTNLPTVTSQVITVTGNPGTSGDNPTIATAKGWTVTG